MIELSYMTILYILAAVLSVPASVFPAWANGDRYTVKEAVFFGVLGLVPVINIGVVVLSTLAGFIILLFNSNVGSKTLFDFRR